jgi:adenosylcobyric acid synthase
MGCHLHGLFAADAWRGALLASLKDGRGGGIAYEAEIDRVLDRLADHLEAHLDIGRIASLARLPATPPRAGA